MEQVMKKTVIKNILILAAVGMIAIIAVSPIRKRQAKDKADVFAQNYPVAIAFEDAEEIGDPESFAEEIMRLVRWEEDTKKRIDQTYQNYRPENLELVKDMSQVSGYQKKEDLERDALAVKWKELRTELETETIAGIENIYGAAGGNAPSFMKQEAVIAYYKKDNFRRLSDAVYLAEEGDPVIVYADKYPGWDYSSGYYSSKHSDSWICPDLLYLLWPEEIRKSYESKLQEAIDGAGQSELDEAVRILKGAVSDVQGLQERYGCTVPNLEKGEMLLEALRQKSREEAAAAEEARKKRIQEQLDKIYSSQHEYYSDPIDPDDYDIEGYYDDYRDEFDDEDDAYDGFLDDEDLWDDY